MVRQPDRDERRVWRRRCSGEGRSKALVRQPQWSRPWLDLGNNLLGLRSFGHDGAVHVDAG